MVKNLTQVFGHLLYWVIGYSLTFLTLSHSNSKTAYALIMGWWLACYVGQITKIRAGAILPAYFLYTVVCIISTVLGNVWFYHGASNEFSLHLLIVILIQGTVFVSPIIVNELTFQIKKFF